MKTGDIITANGLVKVEPVWCEVTGRQVCWQTTLTYAQRQQGMTPAFISFNVYSRLGICKIDFKHIRTF